MAKYDFEEFQEVVEQFQGEMSLKAICEQSSVDYRGYIAWRSRKGLSLPRRKHHNMPTGLIELEVGVPTASRQPSRLTKVAIEFENGLTFGRDNMDVDSLIEFLTKIRPALCLS